MADSEQDTVQDRDARVKQRVGAAVEDGSAHKAARTSSPTSTSYAAQQQPEGNSSAHAEPSAESVQQELWEQLRAKDAQISCLQKKLAHFRQWVTSLHSKVQGINPQAIKNSRRLYIGGIPNGTTDDELRQFFSGLMMKTGALTAPGPALLSCKITRERSYAFLEFRSVEEASNAMAFDGVAFKDAYLKVRRPSNYDPSTAIMLGPVLPDPTLDTSSLDICRTVVEDSWNKIFIGGLPADWGDEQVKELLAPYGALRSFNLVMDKTTGKSKGYAFCEFVDPSMTDFVIKALHARTLNKKMLTVKRALEGSRQGGGKQHMGAPLGSPAAGLAMGGGGMMQAMMHPGLAQMDASAAGQAAFAPGANGMLAAAGALLQTAVGPQLAAGAPGAGANAAGLGGRGSPDGSSSGTDGTGNANGYPGTLHPMAVAHGYSQAGAVPENNNGLLQYGQQPQQQGQGQKGASQQQQGQQQQQGGQQQQQQGGPNSNGGDASGGPQSAGSGNGSSMYMPGTPLGGYPSQVASGGSYSSTGGGNGPAFPSAGAMAAGAHHSAMAGVGGANGGFPVPPQSPVAAGMGMNGYGMHAGAAYW